MSKLHEHLNRSGQSLSAFARSVGVFPNYMSEIASFSRRPSLQVAYDIYRITGGSVPMSYWIDRSDEPVAAHEESIAISDTKSTEETTDA
jgi:transcriptional regulator with XRE-family HTH domain